MKCGNIKSFQELATRYVRCESRIPSRVPWYVTTMLMHCSQQSWHTPTLKHMRSLGPDRRNGRKCMSLLVMHYSAMVTLPPRAPGQYFAAASTRGLIRIGTGSQSLHPGPWTYALCLGLHTRHEPAPEHGPQPGAGPAPGVRACTCIQSLSQYPGPSPGPEAGSTHGMTGAIPCQSLDCPPTRTRATPTTDVGWGRPTSTS